MIIFTVVALKYQIWNGIFSSLSIIFQVYSRSINYALHNNNKTSFLSISPPPPISENFSIHIGIILKIYKKKQ